ncbi:MAG TPA: energy transducer TonB [Stellaceae bacterium]|nr:energy transducer TonB [Stellaceae bacterium]
MRPDNLLDLFEIDRAARSQADGAPAMPLLGTAPVAVEFDKVASLDPERAIAEPSRPPPAIRQWPRLGPILSLALHLLPLLLLLQWTTAPAKIAAPIPVQLVLEPPPPPPRPIKEPKHRPAGRLASIDTGEPAAAPPPPPSPAAVKPAEPGEQPMAAAPLPEPHPSPELVPALPKPAALPQYAAVPAVPKPPPYVKQRRPQPVVARLPNPHPALRRTPFPGTAATRDEYLAYCMTLIRRYYDMLPPSFIAGRHGRTILLLVVRDNGTIAHIAIKQSSGYRDIDSRIERMVSTVRRFPPLPQWIQAPNIELEYVQTFPDGLLRR